MKKKIGVLGSGIVAKTLAAGFLKHGYDVTIGTSDVTKLSDWKSKNEKGKVGSFAEAASFGEILVLAVKGHAAEIVLDKAGVSSLKGKTILDTTNPIDEKNPPVNGVLNYFTNGGSDSLMDRLQKKAPDANFVKCFSIVGNQFMVDPDFGGTKPTMFICGNSDAAKAETKIILDEFGWETEDMGKVESAGTIEALCILWCLPGFMRNQWSHAFKLLKK